MGYNKNKQLEYLFARDLLITGQECLTCGEDDDQNLHQTQDPDKYVCEDCQERI